MASKKNKKTASRKEKKLEQVKQDLGIKEPEVLDQSDKENIRRQCERLDHAKMLSTMNSFIAKYAVFYCNKWYFAAYNRDKNRLVDIFDISFLSRDELYTFNLYKSRVENEIRRKTITPTPEVRPVVAIKQPAPPEPEEEATEE